MNGARSTFMRKGYWLTALAAIVLLVASAGTASAQATIRADKAVAEGDSVTVTVTLKGMIDAAQDADTPTAASHGDRDSGNCRRNCHGHRHRG